MYPIKCITVSATRDVCSGHKIVIFQAQHTHTAFEGKVYILDWVFFRCSYSKTCKLGAF